MFNKNVSSLRGPAGRSLLPMIAVFLLLAPSAFAQSDSEAGAFGEQVELNLLPLLGQGIQVSSGPLPVISGAVRPPPGDSQSVASVQVNLGALGTVVNTGLLTVHTEAATAGDGLSADARVQGLAVSLVPLITLLQLQADEVVSHSSVAGSCGGPLTATGSTTLANVQLGGLLGLGLNVNASPAPNTVLLNLLGIRVVLNEQILGGDGVTGKSVSVNALHISLNNALLTGLGLLSGDIVIAHSEARLACGPATQGADLALAMTAVPNPVNPGETLTYTLTATNQGPGAAAGTTLTVNLPPGVSLLSTSASQGSCGGTSLLTCSLGTLPAGSVVTVTVRVRPAQPGNLLAMGNVTSPAPDPNLANNSASVNTVVQGDEPISQANLRVTKRAESTEVSLGQDLVYIVTVSNQGPNPALSVVVTDLLPSRLNLESVSTSKGSCDDTSIPVICDLGTLAAGAQVTITLIATTGSPGQYANEVTVTSSVADPNEDDNQAMAIITVLGEDFDPVRPPAGACKIDVVPAATLLIPYFEVDLSDPEGRTTLLSISNALAQPQLAHVTIWTDWGIPSHTYDLFLTGFDVETINLRDFFNGTIPTSGANASPRGNRSNPNTNLAGCNAQGVSSQLTAAKMDHLRAWHSGKQSTLDGTCGGSPRTTDLATGYVTVDVVSRCSTLSPADPGYFGSGGVASNTNALWGDYFLVDPSQDSAQGDTAVHIVADPASFGPGNYTFYGRYVGFSGIDARQPLGTRYAAHFGSGGAFSAGTKVVLWRDTKTNLRQGLPCGQEPLRLPLRALVFDEEENSAEVPPSTTIAPWATQMIPVGSSELPVFSSFGWMNLDLWHGSGSVGEAAQGWMSIVMSAEGRYSVGFRAMRLDSACDF